MVRLNDLNKHARRLLARLLSPQAGLLKNGHPVNGEIGIEETHEQDSNITQRRASLDAPVVAIFRRERRGLILHCYGSRAGSGRLDFISTAELARAADGAGSCLNGRRRHVCLLSPQPVASSAAIA